MTSEGFGAELRTYRKEHYLTQEQMAKLLGLSTNHIGTLERGLKKPRASTLAAFETLTEKKSWKYEMASDEEEWMGDADVQAYTNLWRGLKSLEPQREKEVLEMFFRILDWL